jgi:hypothetical protein
MPKQVLHQLMQMALRYLQLTGALDLMDAAVSSLELARDGILERNFYSRFLGIYSSPLRLEFLSSFLPSFVLSTK